MNDAKFIGVPWRTGGRTLAGADCVGLALLWQQWNGSLSAMPNVKSEPGGCEPFLHEVIWSELKRGDTVFFREMRSNKIAHVATCLGCSRLLHIVHGLESRIDNGPALLMRLGLQPAGMVPAGDVQRLCNALADPALGDATTWILLALAVALSAASALLMGTVKPPLGRYGQNALVTSKNPELPLPDVLGAVTLAGQAVYQQLADTKFASTGTDSMWDVVVVFASAPGEAIEWMTGLQVKGTTWSDKSLYDATDQNGMAPNPAQTKAEAISGTINGETLVPSFTVYGGDHAISVPVDVRAQYDRGFPIYGLSGCQYIVFRCRDQAKFANVNFTCKIKGRLCRTFTSSGFTTAAVTDESHTGDGAAVRFKLAHEDIAAVSAVTVDSTAHTLMSATNQTGNVYHLNKTKGYIEFLTAPANLDAILVTYTYYVREWSANPAMQVAYLLTEKLRGRGFEEARLDWASFVAARDYFDVDVSWNDGTSVVSADRFASNYALDARRPATDHVEAILDAAQAALFVSGGKWVLRQMEAGASVFSFTTANIATGANGESLFEWEFMDRSNAANRLRIAYHSADSLNSETEEVVDDENDQAEREPRLGNDGVVEQQLQLPAVTSAAQAQRLAEAALVQQVHARRVFRWTTTVKGLALQPADIVDVTHPTLAVTYNCRITKLDHDEEDRLQIEAVEYQAASYI